MLKRVLKKLRRRAKRLLKGRASTSSRIAALETRVDGLAVHIPTLLNLIPTLRAAIHQQSLTRPPIEADRLAAHLPALLNLAPSLRAVSTSQAQLEENVKTLQSRVDMLKREMEALLDDRLEGRLRSLEAAIEARIERLAARETAFGQHAGSQNEALGQLWDRVEFIRRELMYELRYGAGSSSAAKFSVETKIIDAEKLQRLRAAGLKLNVGCGHLPLQGYINIDRRDLPGVDIVAEADAIPLENGSVEEIAAAHLIEHFPLEEFRRKILPHWHALLKEGGKLRLVTPDAEAMTQGLADSSYDFDDFRDVMFGAQDYDGDFHFNIFTPKSCLELLKFQGFADLEIVDKGRRNGRCFEFELVGYKAPVVPPDAVSQRKAQATFA